MHVRNQIRNEVASALNGAGIDVLKSRAYPIEKTPAVAVSTPSDVVLRDQSTMTDEVRELTVVVEVFIKSVVDYDAQVDDIASRIETVLSDQLLNEIDFYFESFEMDLSDESEAALMVGSLSFSCIYSVARGEPETLR